MKSDCRHGFTLTEILIAIGVIVVLSGIAFPVFARAKAASKKAGCLANEHQLWTGLSLYATDNDERHPVTKTPATLFKKPFDAGMGWAGRVFPYIKSAKSFHCDGDATQSQPKDGTGTELASVSYALNLNVSVTPNQAQMVAPSKTVWLFEVTGNQAHIGAPDEAVGKLTQESDQLSPIGDGTQGAILSNILHWTGPVGQGVFTTYATGHIDNWQVRHAPVADDYEDLPGRHFEGSNFLAADGHSVWLPGAKVSAGGNAKESNSKQTDQGCNLIGAKLFLWPCAEGTDLAEHTLTFSLR